MTGILNRKDLLAFIYITLLAIIAVAYGFTIVPSPSRERQITYDHKRIVDLGELQYSIDAYYQTNNTLPQSLNDISSNSYESTSKLEKNDPETNQPYDYSAISDTSYKLCATFSTDSTQEDPNTYDTTNYNYTSFQSQLKHHTGYQCFTKNETPNSYDNSTPSNSPGQLSPEPTTPDYSSPSPTTINGY